MQFYVSCLFENSTQMGYLGCDLGFSSKEIVENAHYKPCPCYSPCDKAGLGDKSTSQEADLGCQNHSANIDQEPDQGDEKMAKETE